MDAPPIRKTGNGGTTGIERTSGIERIFGTGKAAAEGIRNVTAIKKTGFESTKR